MGDVLPTAHTDPDLAAMVEDSPVGPTPRPRLIVAGPTESFRSLWQDLVAQMDVEVSMLDAELDELSGASEPSPA